MTETEHEDELTEPTVTDVPEPDQDGEEEAAAEAGESPDVPFEEPEPEQEAQGPTQEEWEARFDKAAARFKTYTAQISKIWEEDALHLMPFPLDAGAPTGFIDVRNKGHVEDETKAAVLAFLGFDGETTIEHGQLVPAAVGVESPEVQALRLQGYTIIPPMQTGP